mmetsp:Transcript_40500/g.129085  ORF Transcript_40500/g.129085 Transcript_40500/m.129085 type:complete len:257 (+) Transcript_40500:472-1242(+)
MPTCPWRGRPRLERPSCGGGFLLERVASSLTLSSSCGGISRFLSTALEAGEGSMAIRSRLRHLSLRSTAVRFSIAANPSFLMSAHLPPPHLDTPSMSALDSSRVQGLWCLRRRDDSWLSRLVAARRTGAPVAVRFCGRSMSSSDSSSEVSGDESIDMSMSPLWPFPMGVLGVSTLLFLRWRLCMSPPLRLNESCLPNECFIIPPVSMPRAFIRAAAARADIPARDPMCGERMPLILTGVSDMSGEIRPSSSAPSSK